MRLVVIRSNTLILMLVASLFGVRVVHAQSGACCLGDGTCVDTNQAGCNLGSGDFLGEESTCATTVCLGACCLEEKACADGSRDDCDALAGSFQGANTTCALHCAAKMATVFTYQGQLKTAGVPLTGTADLEFSLWTTTKGGDQVGDTLIMENVSVAGGLFSVQLDFGVSVFKSAARWLEIAVRSPHDDTNTEPFTALSPRQLITATPYALQTRGLFVDDDGNVGVGTDAPAAKLHVNGEMAFSQGQADMRIQEVDPGDPRFLGMINLFGIGIGSNTGGNRQMMMVTDGFGPNPIFTVASSLDSGENWMPRLAVTQEGRIGIGTSTPANPLTVEGTGLRNIYTRNSTGHGIQGETEGANSAGVFGLSLGTGSGVLGQSDFAGVKGLTFSGFGRGVFGHASSSTGTNYGVYGETDSPDGYAGYFEGGRNYFEGKVGIGTDAPAYPMHVETDGSHDRAIYARHTGESGRAVYGEALGSQGKGVAGFSTATSGVNYGVYGSSAGDEGSGVYGLADHLTGATRGILGECRSDSGVGVAGYALSESGATHGVEGFTLSPNGFGVFGKSFDPVGYGVYSLGRLHVEHPAIADSVSWPVGIQNSSHAQHEAGMRVSDDGFFDVTNDALNSSANFARLNNTGNWTVVSDRRLKRDIQPLSGALDKTMALEPVSFRFKNGDATSKDEQIGFIAQDVRKQFPSLVTDGELLTLNYAGMSVVAIAAIQEQQRIIEQLAKENTERETEIGELRSRLARLESHLPVDKKSIP